jgi:hypothetical protein
MERETTMQERSAKDVKWSYRDPIEEPQLKQLIGLLGELTFVSAEERERIISELLAIAKKDGWLDPPPTCDFVGLFKQLGERFDLL